MRREVVAEHEAQERELPELKWLDLREYRMRRYRRHAEAKLHDEEQARAFVDEMGFCFLFPAPGVEMPSLWEAINGREREIPHHHYDPALSLAWNLKDSLPAKKWVWYGKLLRGKPMFVSLALLPAFYALSDNFGELDDYRQQFEEGRMSVEARKVYETLLEHGANSTATLRKLSGLSGGGDPARRFERAIAELQADLKIVKSGVSDDNRWKYCYIYDLLLRRHPEVAEQARAISSREARKIILLRYLRNSGAVAASSLPALFGWDTELTRRTVGELLADDSLREVRLTGAPAPSAKKTAKSIAAKKARAVAPADVLLAGGALF